MGLLHEAKVFFIGETPESKTEARLLRKIDTTILSFVCLNQFVNYLDRANLANAYVSGMKEEIGFTGTQYNTAVSIFTAGYIIGGIPNALIVSSNRIRLSIWFPFCCMMWGILTLALGFCHHVYQVQVIRFFQALFEASTFAGSHYILGTWYKPSELGKRACLVTAASNGGTMFSGILQGAIQSTLDGRRGMAGWRWLFIIDSLITAPVWILGFWTFPDTPANTRAFYINEDERALAVARLPPHKPTKLDWGVFKKVGSDWRFYAFTIMFSINTNMEYCGLYSIMSLYLKWTGEYTIQQINYYPLGTTSVIIASTCLFALWTDYTKSRWWVNIVMAVCAGISAILLLVWDIPLSLKFFAYYFAGMGYIGQAVNFSWANEVTRDDDQLRSLTLYSMVYGSNVTFVNLLLFSIAWFNIALFPVTAAPRFRNGLIAVIVTCVLSPPMAIVVRHLANKRKAELASKAAAAAQDQASGAVVEYDDTKVKAGDNEKEDVGKDTVALTRVTSVLAG
ncbi:hypothetical protein IAT38_007359 [Cryptococcus sp. DSM 104549]